MYIDLNSEDFTALKIKLIICLLTFSAALEILWFSVNLSFHNRAQQVDLIEDFNSSNMV